MTIVFVAGASGAVGSALVPVLRQDHFEVIPHVRPKTAVRHPLGKDPQALVADLSDVAKLDAAMARAQAIVCSVGTMRRRFAAGDTYESSDYQPVAQLVESALRMKSRPFFVLVSALGARPGSGYLGWKFKAEELVRKSGLPQAILRPSFLDSTHAGSQPSDGKQRAPPSLVGAVLRGLGALPGLKGTSLDLRPIPVEVLCKAIARLLRESKNHPEVLTGRQLWPLAESSSG
jgi:uncharacterized protein YbjT (DUF2867 family)